VVTGLIVAATAVIPLMWFVSSGAEEATPPEVAPPVETTTAPVQAPVTETMVIVPDPVEVDGLPESVVRALEAAGNVREELGEEIGLPQSVVKALADRDVVLRVAEEASP